MSSPASEIVLSEVDAELTLLGTLFLAPEAFEFSASGIRPEWFSDPFSRYLFEQAVRIHDAGNRLSPPAIMAALPEDCGGITRGQLYAKACASGLPPTAIGGLVHTLKDRWARRTLIEVADELRHSATSFEADPYAVAEACVGGLDTIGASKTRKSVSTLADANAALVKDMENADTLRGASTGILALNNKLNGYKRGQLYVIAGRPGMGKSAYMCSSLRRTAETGVGVAIFSLEMTMQEISARMIADACDTVQGPMFGNLLKGALRDEQKEMFAGAIDHLDALPMHIEDDARLTFAEIASRARRTKAQMEARGVRLGVVCIDHMGLVTPSDRYAGNKVAEAGEVSGRARALAKELDCCVILLCQLSRDVEKRDDKRPIMSDLRWSGEIEQDAHVVAFLYREAYYLQQDPNVLPDRVSAARFMLEFLIRKNRNGETGDVPLWCSIGHSSIRDLGQ